MEKVEGLKDGCGSISFAASSSSSGSGCGENMQNAAVSAQTGATVTIKCMVQEGAALPEYQTKDSAGADIRAFLPECVIIAPGGRSLIPTGLSFEIPSGYEVQVRPRSGLAIKNGITCLNAPGTIDADYRGEVKVILYNAGSEPFTVNNGDRIAQVVVAPVTTGYFQKVSELSSTERGSGGFGSTGK